MSLVEDLLASAIERATCPPPESTYRLQFHAGFTFRDALAIVPYLADLGITHCYASPYLKARPGSQHGYDITDHSCLNPEVGCDDDFNAWIKALRDHGMGHILDMVPNHMGIVGNANAWWNDVLENGRASPYAGFFDIAWEDAPRPGLDGRVLLPILGDPYGKVLEAGQLRLNVDRGTFAIHYFDHRFPVAARSYRTILEPELPALERALGADAAPVQEFKSILTALSHLPGPKENDSSRSEEVRIEKEVVKRRLVRLSEETAEVRTAVTAAVAAMNGTAGDPHSFDRLEALLDEQAYRLAFWRVSTDEINYRRFFEVNELAALSMEKSEVFKATHALILRLLAAGQIDGLRIDHPDGLFDPAQYLRRLQEQYLLECARQVYDSNPACKESPWESILDQVAPLVTSTVNSKEGPLYVVVEKILGEGETLPADWLTQGTSGYDFMNLVNGLFVDSGAEAAFSRLYRDWAGADLTFAEVAFQKKYLILGASFSGEWRTLAGQLDRIAQGSRQSRDFTLNSLRLALGQLIACFPVYRSYLADGKNTDEDRNYIESATRRAILRNRTTNPTIFRFIRNVLLDPDAAGLSMEEQSARRFFAGRFQQLTSPIMAKGVEDTAFYVYNRLLSLNEVGGDPGRFGLSCDKLQRTATIRASRYPRALSPLSTHDTKRSEDVRARLNILSEMPDEWRACLERWGALNASQRIPIDDEPAPDRNEEYLIYQTFLGAWPLVEGGAEDRAHFVSRMQEYLIKALHEAKVHTSWINPNEEYDEAVRKFTACILDENTSAAFLKDFRQFQRRISHFGLLNSLSQTLLKFTLPGVPDTYQGTELWDFSLVDPDNRRPVDFDLRRRLLQELLSKADTERPKFAADLMHSKEDGRVKLYVSERALHCRQDQPGLFAEGEYVPGEAVGAQRGHLFGFARRQGNSAAVVAVPRLMTTLCQQPDGLPLGQSVWGDTRLIVPNLDPNYHWKNIFTGEVVDGADGFLAGALFAHLSVALLVAEPR